MSGKTQEQEVADAAVKEFKTNLGITETKGLLYGTNIKHEQTTNEQRLKAVAAFDKAYKDQTLTGYNEPDKKYLYALMNESLKEPSIKDEMSNTRMYITTPIDYRQGTEAQRLIRSTEAAKAKNHVPKFPFKPGEVPTNGGKAKASKKRDKSKSGGRSHSRSKSKARSKSKSKSKARSKSKSKKGKT